MDFEGIYQSYCKDVFRYLRSLSAGEDLAEEITQETFAKALKAIDQFQGDKDIRAWLFTIAKHTYYTHCKREKRTTGEEFPPSIPGPEKPLVEQIIDRERAFQDRNNEEILEQLHISKNTLLKHLQNLYRKCGVSSRWDLLKLR